MFCILLLLIFDLIVCAAEEDSGYKPVRLVGGENDREGRVEVYHNGSWATICDDRWDIRDAYVVCRQVGFYDAVKATVRASLFGGGEGEILYENSNCVGNEAYLNDCPHSAYGDHNCSHGEDAGVICGGPYFGTGESSIYEVVDSPSSLDADTGGTYQQSSLSPSSFLWDIQEASLPELSYGLQEDVSRSNPTPTPDDGSTSVESLADPCLEDKCENGATCTYELDNLYICICVSNWTGVYCQLPVLDNDTENEEEFDNYTEYEEVGPTEYSSIDDEFDRLTNVSTINSTITPGSGTTEATTVVTISTAVMVTTSYEDINESTQGPPTTDTMPTSNVRGNDATTAGDIVVTDQDEVEKTPDVTGSYTTQEDRHPTTSIATTTNTATHSKAWNATIDVKDDHEVTVTEQDTTTTEHSHDVTDLKTATVTQVVTSTEFDQLPLISTTSDNVIETTNNKYTEIGKGIQDASTKLPTSPTIGYKLTTQNKDGIDKPSSTVSLPVLVDGSADSSQSNTSSIDIETFVLIGLGILIIILIVLIAITLINKGRTKNNNRSPDIVVVESGTSENTESSKSTEYTNVAFDDVLTQTPNDTNSTPGSTPPKVYMPSISSALQLSSSSSTAAPSTSGLTRQSKPDEVLTPSTIQDMRRSDSIETRPTRQNNADEVSISSISQPTSQSETQSIYQTKSDNNIVIITTKKPSVRSN